MARSLEAAALMFSSFCTTTASHGSTTHDCPRDPKSSSNGLVQPAGDTFAFDQQIYETQHDVTTGLGPVTTPEPVPSAIKTR